MTKQENLLIIPLGGLGEIGKNMTVFQYGEDIVILDAGLAFPDDEMLGIDLVIPDMTYLMENRDKVRAVVLTHGHEDHIGALSYLLREINVPVYGSRLALGLVEGRLEENKVSGCSLVPVEAGDQFSFGAFEVGFIQGNHSIPDAFGIYLKTPVGTVVHTGDFKVDPTPVDGKLINLRKFAQLGEQGVLVLLSDSTNAEKAGHTGSELEVAAALDAEFANAQGRVIVATFASNVSRIQMAVNSAAKQNRKLIVFGRSMLRVIEIATTLGYLSLPEGMRIEPEEIGRFRDNQIMIVTTGSQGEPMAGLSRMATNKHRNVAINSGDTVLIAATPIPGNEKTVSRTIDNLLRLGAHVVYERSSKIHVSGHAGQEDLKLMLNLVRPQFFIPVHGEYRMQKRHGKLAEEMGITKENIFIGENGHVFEFSKTSGRLAGKVKAGKVFIDGLGVGDIGNIVIRDRHQLANDGVLIVLVSLDKAAGQIVSGPDIVSRGFIYVRESDQLMREIQAVAVAELKRLEAGNVVNWTALKQQMREVLGRFIYEKTGRRPMILTVIMDV